VTERKCQRCAQRISSDDSIQISGDGVTHADCQEAMPREDREVRNAARQHMSEEHLVPGLAGVLERLRS
jgi:hypothetical protein